MRKLLTGLILATFLALFFAGSASAKVSNHPIYKYAPIKIGGSDRQNEVIAFAWDISQDPDWIATLEAENGLWTTDRVGVTGDRGLCQLNPRYHWAFINSPEFNDYKQQLLYCAQVYSQASQKGRISTTFYGWNRRAITKNNFIWR